MLFSETSVNGKVWFCWSWVGQQKDFGYATKRRCFHSS